MVDTHNGILFSFRKEGMTLLVVQWLRLCASTAGEHGFKPWLGTEIPHALWLCQKKKKKKEILTHDPTWMSPEDITLSAMCWSQKSKRCMIPLTWGTQNSQIYRNRKENGDCGGDEGRSVESQRLLGTGF